MLSLILPYWKRPQATDESLALMAGHYPHLDMEIVIVDDGSPEPYVIPAGLPWPARVIHLSQKTVPLNPCVPINEGVKSAYGEIIAISNPEMLHKMPVLGEMLDSIKDDKDYILAAAWCEEQKRWHCHSTNNRRNDNDVGEYIPIGTDYHFLGMMRRRLWDEAGGFDEDYRDGAGYDDPDFVRRLHRAGAKFLIKDDLIVEHPRKNAHSEWTVEGFARNRALFLSKWKPC